MPASVVVAVQSSLISGPAIAKIQKTGPMFHPLVAGDGGEVALVTYSDRITLRQEFTRDAGAISAAFQRIEPDGGGAAMNDAVLRSVQMLAARSGARRRVVMVIGESKDRSSKAKIEEAISEAQAANVVIYAVSYSATWTAFTSRGAEQFPSGKPVYSSSSGGLIEIFTELGRAGAKNVMRRWRATRAG